MKFLYSLLKIGFFFICLNTNSQTSSKVKQLLKIKTYINYKIINSYLNQAINQEPYTSFKSAYSDNKSILIKNPIQQSGSDNELLSLLNQKFQIFHLDDVVKISNINLEELSKKSNEDAVNEMTKIIIEKINSHNNPNIKIEKIDQIKKDALTEYNNMSNGSSQNLEEADRQKPENDKKESPPIAATVNTNIENTKNNEQNMASHEQAEFFSMNGLNLWNLISLLISISTLFIVSLTRNNRKKSTNAQEAPKVPEKIHSITHVNPMSAVEFERYLTNSPIISNISEYIHLQKINPERPQAEEKKELQPIADNSFNTNVFYLVKPINETYFSKTNMKYAKSGMVYKFTIKNDNQNEATFEVISDGEDPNDIATRNQDTIKPACDEENIPGRIVRKIITLKLGHVSLEGDKWIIKTKALIKYE